MKGENNMKKLLIFLFLCLLALTSCGKRTVNAHGKIIARETDENGRLISVVADTEMTACIPLSPQSMTHALAKTILMKIEKSTAMRRN